MCRFIKDNLPKSKSDRRYNYLSFIAHPAAMDHIFLCGGNICVVSLHQWIDLRHGGQTHSKYITRANVDGEFL